MHEIAIAETILDIIDKEAKKNNIATVRKARLRIGRMAAFEKTNLEMCLATYRGGSMAAIDFEIDEMPVSLRCSSCGQQFTDERFEDRSFAHLTAHAPALYQPPPCPGCGHPKAHMVSGQEMELISIEGS